MNHRSFILVALVSFSASLVPLLSEDEGEVEAFMLVSLLFLGAILLLLVSTSKYWRGARSVR